jgi:hypothetical protein
MKIMILLLVPCAMLVGQQTTKEKKPAPKAAPATATESAQKIPDGAKELEPYLYSYTDPQGKKWLYRQTPFGVVKWEDKPAAPAIIDNTNPVVITDLGDSVRFQWKTPFGDQKWVRKKSELTEEEKAMIKREDTKRAAPDPKAGDKPPDAGKPPEKQ